MFDIGLLGKVGAGLVLGLGTLWWIWRRLARAEKDSYDAVTRENWIKADLERYQAEQAANKAANEARNAQKDPLDW